VSERVLSDATDGLDEVAAFLRGTLPFSDLGGDRLREAAEALRVSYHARGAVFTAEDDRGGLRILRSGAVDLRDGSNKLLDRLGEGESFHVAGLNAEYDGVRARVIEDALLYRLPDEVYGRLRAACPDFDAYFSAQRSRRLGRSASRDGAAPMLQAPVRGSMSRDVLTVTATTTIRATAAAMARRRVSSALVVSAGEATGAAGAGTAGDADGGQQAVLGIVTDRDLRSRVLAVDRSPAGAVVGIMTADPEGIDADASLFAATLAMTRRGVHHLPVFETGRLVGILTTSDLMLARRDDPVYLVQRLSRQETAEDIRRVVAALPELTLNWSRGGMRAAQVAQVLTAISDAVTVRLIQLAEAELGPAPAPWAWLAFGSQARREQLLAADQDNGIVIADTVSEGELAWYRRLATRVCDGLAVCGYRYCPGGIMATTERWCQTLGNWQETVRAWTRTPTPDAVMRVSIFFDIRPVYGDTALANALQREMLSRAGQDTIFQAALAANVLAVAAPLGIFRRFVVDRDGEHRDSLDIKKRGVLAVTEIVRLHALAHGVAAVNTGERLQALQHAGHLAAEDVGNLADALDVLQDLRLRHQCAQLAAGEAVDNFIDPRSLPRLAREQLRDAFTIIDEAQGGVRQTYRAGLA
jgi:CBS domain-containing protein